VLFVCIQNAGRSQMAQALFVQAAQGRHEARSAGSRPAARVHPVVAEAMAEVGIDVSGNVPHRLDADDMRWADEVVTMGCGDECPFIPGKHYTDWDLSDPSDQPIEVVRQVREEISRRVTALAAALNDQPSR
jgi:arsenate reductase